MAYTFGAATSDRISSSTANAGNSTDKAALVFGWWYPTSLTATRKYWGRSNAPNTGMQVDTTTSELRWTTEHATTSGQWTSSGAGITTNDWWFIATLMVTATTSAAAFRAWVGSITQPPIEVSISQATAPVGNMSAGGTFVWCNDQGNATAFQGDFGEGTVLVGPASLNSQPFYIASNSSISQDEADFVAGRYVWPAWRGERIVWLGGLLNAFHTNAGVSLPVTHQGCRVSGSAAATQPGIAATITGATWTDSAHPRRSSSLVLHPYRRH